MPDLVTSAIAIALCIEHSFFLPSSNQFPDNFKVAQDTFLQLHSLQDIKEAVIQIPLSIETTELNELQMEQLPQVVYKYHLPIPVEHNKKADLQDTTSQHHQTRFGTIHRFINYAKEQLFRA